MSVEVSVDEGDVDCVVEGVDVGDVVGVVTVQSWNPPFAKASTILFKVVTVVLHSLACRKNALPTHSTECEVPVGPVNSVRAVDRTTETSVQLFETTIS